MACVTRNKASLKVATGFIKLHKMHYCTWLRVQSGLLRVIIQCTATYTS